MTSPTEQMFLYGDVDREYPYPTGILALIGYSDLTAAGGIVLALIILIGMAVDYWAELGWFSQVLARLVFSPMKILASRARSLFKQFEEVRSARGSPAMLLVTVYWVLKPVADFVLLCVTPFRWFFPSNRPVKMLCRLIGSAIVCTKAYSGMLLPGFHFLYGLFTGLISRSMEQSVYCPDILQIFDLIARPTRRQWLEQCYCLGAETGLEMRVIIEDDWKLFRLVGRLVDGEIYHLHAVALAVLCGALIILAPWWSEIVSWAGSCWVDMLVQLTGDAATKDRLRRPSSTERESQLLNAIKDYEGDVCSLKGLLKAKTEELRESKRIQDDGWAHAKMQASQLGEIEACRAREAGETAHLRTQIDLLSKELRGAQCKEAEATLRMRKQSSMVDKLEQELEQRDEQAFPSDTISRRSLHYAVNDQLAIMEQRLERRLAAAEERDDNRYQRLSARVDVLKRKPVQKNNHAPNQPNETQLLRSQLESRNEQLAIAEKRRADVEERENQTGHSYQKLSAEVDALKHQLAQKDEQVTNFLIETNSLKAEGESRNEQLTAVQKCLAEAEEREVQSGHSHQKLSAKVTVLKNQLAKKDEQAHNCLVETNSLKAECDARNEQFAAIEQSLAAAEAREKQSSTNYRQLSARHDELAANNSGILAKNEELQNKYNDIFFMSEPVAEIKALEQERDCAKEQVIATEQRLAEAKARESQYSTNYQQLSAEHKLLSDRHDELVANNCQLTAQNGDLQTQYKDLSSLSKSVAETSALEQRMNEAEARENQARGIYEQLSAEHQQLSVRYDELVANNGQLAAKHEDLQKQYKDVCLISEPVGEICALELQVNEAEDRENKLSAEYKQLSARHDELTANNRQLAAKHEDLQKQYKDVCSISEPVGEICDLELRLNEAENRENKLSAEYKQLSVRHDELQGQYDELFFMAEPGADVTSLQRERDCVKEQLRSLQSQHTAMKQTAETYYQETQESLGQAAKRDEALRQSLGDLKSAYEMTLEQERSAAKESQKRASKAATEVKDHQRKIELALRDVQRKHEEAEKSKQTIAVLEHRLSKYTAPQGDGDTPKRQTSNIGSVSTALAESRVTVSKQQTEINDLKRYLEQAKGDATRPADEPLRGEIAKLRKALDTEKRARTDDQIRWDKRTKELQAENQKLTISRSNASATRGGLRKPSRT